MAATKEARACFSFLRIKFGSRLQETTTTEVEGDDEDVEPRWVFEQ